MERRLRSASTLRQSKRIVLKRLRSASTLRQSKRMRWEKVMKALEQRKTHRKVKLTLSVDAGLVQRARDLRLNISSITETALFMCAKWLKKKREVKTETLMAARV